MAKKTKKKSVFSKIVVIGVILLNVVFTGIVLWTFLKTYTEPSALIVAWFSFTTVELWSLAGIKKAKEKRNDNYVD